ncbi:MAG: LuxR C-terminal-related transcriptional regulator [Erysipelotrichaceae bacterium]|nr:LuxR C-terminal-related transcriptional regulator [Erysipelotrichaceae bacterium]
MSYNKNSEVNKWKQMKEKEEEILRENGMSEESIQILHDYDWDVFKAERIYKTKQYVDSYLVENAVTTIELPVDSIDDILSLLDNEELYKAMKKINHKLTFEILRLRINGYSRREIAKELDMTFDSVKYYLKKARKKINS